MPYLYVNNNKKSVSQIYQHQVDHVYSSIAKIVKHVVKSGFVAIH